MYEYTSSRKTRVNQNNHETSIGLYVLYSYLSREELRERRVGQCEDGGAHVWSVERVGRACRERRRELAVEKSTAGPGLNGKRHWPERRRGSKCGRRWLRDEHREHVQMRARALVQLERSVRRSALRELQAQARTVTLKPSDPNIHRPCYTQSNINVKRIQCSVYAYNEVFNMVAQSFRYPKREDNNIRVAKSDIGSVISY